jgi:GGDEF domain-containing protein
VALQESIATLDLVLEDSPIQLSASFGLVAYDGSETEESLLHRADMAMYAEKRRRTSQLSLVR